MPARAIVFDFDGVIVDSEPAHAYAIEVALASMGLAFPGKDDYTKYIGKGDREVFAEVVREQGLAISDPDMERLVERKAGAFVAALNSGMIRPYRATVELILAAAVPVAVCSGSFRESVDPVLDRLGLTPRLRTVVTASDVARTKPDPAPYLLAADRLGVAPSLCVAVEDSPTGIRSARDAGYTVHAVCHSLPADRLAEAHRIHASAESLTLSQLLNATVRA